MMVLDFDSGVLAIAAREASRQSPGPGVLWPTGLAYGRVGIYRVRIDVKGAPWSANDRR